MIADELEQSTRQPGEILVVRGRHKYHGNTILIRDETRCMAVVEDTRLLDTMLEALSTKAPEQERPRSFGHRRGVDLRRV